jgi:hypothetical protein
MESEAVPELVDVYIAATRAALSVEISAHA